MRIGVGGIVGVVAAVGVAGCNQVLGIGDVNAPLIIIVDGPGHVQSSTIQLDCTRRCAVPIDAGQQVVLDAVPLAGAGASFARWDGVPCPSPDCIIAGGVTATITAHFDGPNWVFVDLGPYSGELGGLDGADASCNATAQKHDLEGHYVAFLSSTAQKATDRLRAGARGWMLVDGEPVVASTADLIAHQMRIPVYRDADGMPQYDVHTWTGTNDDLTIATDTCQDWTSSAATDLGKVGGAAWANGQFTDLGPRQCRNKNGGLYCFQDDRAADLPPPPVRTGRIAFVGTGFQVGSGIGAADTLCHDQAAAASLPGTYRALLATSTASAASRFDTGGPAWVRVDGMPIAATAADFMNGPWLAPLDQAADGSPADHANYGVASGARIAVGTSGVAESCKDWSSNAGADTLLLGDTDAITVAQSFGSFSADCSGTWNVYCLQM